VIKLLNILLRSFGLIVRFGFLLFLAKELSAEDFSAIALIFSGVGYFSIILGFELHNKYNKEIATSSNGIRYGLISESLSVYLLLCMLVAPILTMLSSFFVSGKVDLFLIYIALCCDYISVEFSRILNHIGRQISSSIVIFVKSGLWCILLLLDRLVLGAELSIERIMVFWITCSCASCLLGCISIALNSEDFKVKVKFNLTFLSKRLKEASVMFGVSLTYQAFFFFDKLFIGLCDDPKLLAQYIIYMTSATSLLTVIDAGIVSFYAPKILVATHQKNIELLLATLKEVVKKITFIMLFTAPVLMFFIIKYAEIYGGHANQEYGILVTIYFSVIIFGFGTVAHMVLYGLDQELEILKIQVYSSLIFALSSGCSIILKTPIGVPISMLISFVFMIAMKIRYSAKFLNLKKAAL
jgi:O-antigen/teichoic acid export membrane protein